MSTLLITLTLIIILTVIIWHRIPILGDELSKQTLYVGFLDILHGHSKDPKAYAMWIDDDSSIGVFKVKEIADTIGITPNFAVIANKMEPEVADSLASWQRQGAGIILHGLRHEQWWDWDASQIEMISGANLVNPDRHVFQYGRISIDTDTDIEAMRQLLQKAYNRKAFVIFCTHSSISESFSTVKTVETLRIAKEIGFVFKYK